MSNVFRDQYQALVLSAKPVGYWPLTINGNDSTSYARHARYCGSPEFISDDTGGWLHLDGSSFLEVPGHSDYSQPASLNGLTVEVWMKAHSLHYPNLKRYIHWLGKGEPQKQEWGFRLYSDDGAEPSMVSAYVWNKEGGEGAGAHLRSAISSKQWMHLVACFEPGDASDPDRGVLIYRDGEFQQGPLSPTTLYDHAPRWRIFPASDDAPLRFGTRSDPTRSPQPGCLEGGLAEIAIYPRVLEHSEIIAHFQAGAACFL